jgi:signal recognition particle receptor subunit beta
MEMGVKSASSEYREIALAASEIGQGGPVRPAGGPDSGPRLGENLRQAAVKLRAIIGELQPLVADGTADDLASLRKDLGADICRIAVIGQVKAGKSSLLNALLRYPGLIPSDVNPWTSVVTNLHFGQSGNEQHGAVFNFFDDNDWNHLASGGRLQELTARLGIPVDQRTLTGQVVEMRGRAEARLGRQFHHLLGKQHRFATASSDILARYVCVGELEEETATGPVAGRFADITKSAELFLEGGPFAYPTTVVDTPGTNDPFLVRDEITRRQLERADVYIVVLTAQQTLSDADLGLLRLLHGLHKQRLIVFINRIDLLGEVAADAARVARHTKVKLAEEYPGAAIPVIVGSAHWGGLGLEPDGFLAAGEAGERFLDYARSTRRIDPDQAASAAALRHCSGLVELETAIDGLMNSGPAMFALQRARNTLMMILADAVQTIQSDLAGLSGLIASRRQGVDRNRHHFDTLDDRIGRFEAAPGELAAITKMVRDRLGEIKEVTIQQLKVAFDAAIRRYAQEQADALRATLQKKRLRVWRCETRSLRLEMEQIFLENYRDAAKGAGAAEMTAHDRLVACLKNAIADFEPQSDHRGTVQVVDPTPSISALGTTVALDLGEAWGRWWRQWRGADQRAEKLAELIVAEFMPVALALTDSAAAELDSHAAVAVERWARSGRDLTALLEQRKAYLLKERQALVDQTDHEATLVEIAAGEREQQSKRLTLQQLERLVSGLQEVHWSG